MSLRQDSGGGLAATWLRRAGDRIGSAIRHLLRSPARKRPDPLSGRALAFGAAACIGVFLAVCLVLDSAAITGARRLPTLVVDVFNELTDFGKSGWFLYPFGAVLVATALAPPALPRMAQLTLSAIAARAGFVFLAIGLPGLFTTVAKRVIGRARPFVGGQADPFLYKIFDATPAYGSLPSGHSTTAFAAAIAIGALWPRMRMVMWIYAGIICLSRVVITAHHPSDVFAGALVGTVGALMVRNYFAARRLVFGVSPQGRIVPFAGPSRRRMKAVARTLLSE